MFVVKEMGTAENEDMDDVNMAARMLPKEEMEQYFIQEEGLEYFDMFVFPNNSCYRG